MITTNMKMTIFDIETGPRPLAELESIMPEFDAGAVLKDPAKIAAKLEEKKQDWLANAALSAQTGKVLAIGLLDETGLVTILEGDEKLMLESFWKILADYWQTRLFVGFNCMAFDLPFMVRRSLILGVFVPLPVRFLTKYRHDGIDDLMESWRLWTDERISLNNLAKLLGVGEKAGNGSDFARLYETDRPAALDYLRQDLNLTQAIAKRML